MENKLYIENTVVKTWNELYIHIYTAKPYSIES